MASPEHASFARFPPQAAVYYTKFVVVANLPLQASKFTSRIKPPRWFLLSYIPILDKSGREVVQYKYDAWGGIRTEVKDENHKGDKQCAARRTVGILQAEKAEMLDNKITACLANVGIERKLLKQCHKIYRQEI